MRHCRAAASALAAMLLFICALASGASAQDYKRLSNRWTGVQIHVEHGMPEASAAEPGWWSADWIVEPVEGYVRLKNRWTSQYLHVEHGALEAGAIEPGWWSAQWTLEPAEAGFVRIVNRWTGVYLNVEKGPLVAGAIELGWWSAQWQISGGQISGGQISGGQISGGQVAAAAPGTQPTSSAAGGGWQGRTWEAYSAAAMSSTGKVTANPDAIVFQNGSRVTVRVAQDGVQGKWGFGPEIGNATIFQVIPPDMNPVLLENNRLCGNSQVTYIALWIEPAGGMTMSFFTGPNIPGGIEQDDVCSIQAYG